MVLLVTSSGHQTGGRRVKRGPNFFVSVACSLHACQVGEESHEFVVGRLTANGLLKELVFDLQHKGSVYCPEVFAIPIVVKGLQP